MPARSWRSATRQLVPRSATSLHCGVAGGATGRERRQAARDHSGSGAGALRPAARLPVQSALHVRDRAHKAVPPELRGWKDGHVRCHYPLGDRDARCPHRGRSHPGKGSVMTALIAARDLERTYEIGGGLFRSGLALARGWRRVVRRRGRADAGGGRRIRLREIHARAHDHHDRCADRRHAHDRRPRRGPSGERADLRCKVQIVFQNPYGSLNPRKTVHAILEEPLMINTSSRQRSAARAAARCCASRLAARICAPLSAYVLRRPAPAHRDRARPDAAIRPLVADEPVSALDVSVQAHVLNLLADLQRDLSIAYLFISHDLGVVSHIAHDVMVMYLGLAVEHGPKQSIFCNAAASLYAGVAGFDPGPWPPPRGCFGQGRIAVAAQSAGGLRVFHALLLRH